MHRVDLIAGAAVLFILIGMMCPMVVTPGPSRAERLDRIEARLDALEASILRGDLDEKAGVTDVDRALSALEGERR